MALAHHDIEKISSSTLYERTTLRTAAAFAF
jgi:hypothetical protein